MSEKSNEKSKDNSGLKIPQFTADDYRLSPKPYEWIIEHSNENVFVRQQLVSLMAINAIGVGVKNFVTLWKSYDKSLKGAKDTYTNMSDLSGTNDQLQTGLWIVNDNGVYKENSFGDMEYACSHPIYPMRRYTNIDTGAESISIAYYRAGRQVRTKIIPRSDLASANKIVKLSEYGVGVTSENARSLVRYLSEVEALNYETIPELNSCDHMGWTGTKYREFSPYIKDLEFEGQENFKSLFESVQAKGHYDRWLKLIRNYRKDGNKIVRIAMASSFASVLLKPFNALPFFVHMWGETETGKSVALLAAVSVWANPTIGKYAYTFNSTDVGNELYAACLNSLPLCIDELQILNKRSDFDEIIYRLCEGTGRLRGKKEGGVQSIKTWRNCIITTGEKPITNLSSGGGAVNRVIEIECNNGKFFTQPREFCEVIQHNYGHAGKEFIEKLTAPGALNKARELYEENIQLLQNCTEATDKQIASGAAILTADSLAEQWIFNDGIRLTANDIKPYLATKTSLDVNVRAYEYLREEITANYVNFTPNAVGERWGKTENNIIYIMRNRFNEILSKGGFNPQSLLSWMDRNQKLIRDKDNKHMTVLKRMDGGRARCVGIPIEDSNEFEDIEINESEQEELPF